MKPELKLPMEWLRRPVMVALVGCGGNGSQMLSALARIHLSLQAVGNPYGLTVDVYDPDTVTEANCARQLFSSADVGRNKAIVLVNRINLFFGLNWRAHSTVWGNNHSDLVIGCVDSSEGRQAILATAPHWWLDLGNTARTGQVILGGGTDPRARGVKQNRLFPYVTDILPQILVKDAGENEPSCSLMAALNKQDLFINQHLATWASTLLWNWFRQGELDVHGYYINIESGKVAGAPIDPDSWARMGWFGGRDIPWRKVCRIIKRRKKAFYSQNRLKLVCGHIVDGYGTKKARCPQCARDQYLGRAGKKLVEIFGETKQ